MPKSKTSSSTSLGPGPHYLTGDFFGSAALLEPMIIDATTQPGWAANNRNIVLLSDDGFLGGGLVILGGGSTIRGLTVQNRALSSGFISVETQQVLGFFIYVPVATPSKIASSAPIPRGNSAPALAAEHYSSTPGYPQPLQPNRGIHILQSTGNTIRNNVIAIPSVLNTDTFAASTGILVEKSFGTVIQGNYIGTKYNGSEILGIGEGIAIEDSQFTVIGGTDESKRNVLFGYTKAGVAIRGNSVHNFVVGNHIGTDRTGVAANPFVWLAGGGSAHRRYRRVQHDRRDCDGAAQCYLGQYRRDSHAARNSPQRGARERRES